MFSTRKGSVLLNNMVEFTKSQALFLLVFGVLTPSLDLYTDLKMGLRLLNGPPRNIYLHSGKNLQSFGNNLKFV